MKIFPNLSTLLVILIGFTVISASSASETTLWDGHCRNITHKLDGHLKLFTVQDGNKITGFISISGWLVGSGEIKGTRNGNIIAFTSVDATGQLKINWEGVIKDGVLSGEYYIGPIPAAKLGPQIGEFKIDAVSMQEDGIPESEKSFKQLFGLALEADLNAPVKMNNGTVVFGADALFQSVHPAGTGVSIRLTDVDIDWKPDSSHKKFEDIRRYTIYYTLFWHGLITDTGWTRLKLSYNANLGSVTEHEIIESSGITKSEANEIAFGIGVIIGKIALESWLNDG